MSTQKRIALVIGNSNYGVGREVSGVENALAIKDCIEKLGFTVHALVRDAGIESTIKALDDFALQIRDASVVLLFYSGHGVQIDNQNYLIPTDGSVSASRAIALRRVLQKLSRANNAIKIVVLDTCRDNLVPSDGAKGPANPSEAPKLTLQAFAASPGQLAESGKKKELSVYTKALLKYLPEPGLELKSLFPRVRTDVFQYSKSGQRTFEAGEWPAEAFYFRDPVYIQAKTPGWPHAHLIAILNGEVVLSTAEEFTTPELPLKAGENELLLLVSNANTFADGGQSWTLPSGWSYHLDLVLPDGSHAIEDREATPFKSGPHHGKAFEVAKAFIDVTVHPETLAVEVKLRDVDTNVWRNKTPIWARDQEVLFEETITGLNLTPDEILDGASLGKWAPLLKPLVAEFLKSGKILGQKVADPARTFAMVWGNKALRSAVQNCMTAGRADRIRDLKASIAAALRRAPRPFDLFDQGLMACIREKAADLPGFQPNDLRIWTAFQERPETPAAAGVATAATAEAMATPPAGALAADRGTSLSDENLRTLAQNVAFHPRENEVLLDRRTLEQSVQGVPVVVEVHTFLSLEVADDHILFHARSLADLSDFQNKIGPVIDTIPLPTDNCSRFALDNLVARIWGKQITVDGAVATLRLNGDVEVWACVKNPIPCSRIDWEDREGPFGIKIRVPVTVFYDCNPPIKNKNLTQPFEATLPFTLGVVDADTVGLQLGNPTVDLGGALGGVTEGILRIAGVDISARAKEALDRAINPESLRQNLPDFLLAYNPTLTRAELFSNSGVLAASFEMDVKIDFGQLGDLFQMLASRPQAAGG